MGILDYAKGVANAVHGIKNIERECFPQLFELHRQFSDEAQQKMLGCVRELEERISNLPRGIKGGLDPQQIAKMVGESPRQHFLQSGMPDKV